jgi:hypothetical protein
MSKIQTKKKELRGKRFEDLVFGFTWGLGFGLWDFE